MLKTGDSKVCDPATTETLKYSKAMGAIVSILKLPIESMVTKLEVPLIV